MSAKQTHSLTRVALPRLVVPLDLWLQWHGDGYPKDDGEVCESEVTWSREKIFEGDVEYVHADEIRRALMGHRCSELWGDKGLIAATMRCVEALDLIEEAIVDADGPAEDTVERIRDILWHNVEWWHRRREARIQKRCLSPVATHDLIVMSDVELARNRRLSRTQATT